MISVIAEVPKVELVVDLTTAMVVVNTPPPTTVNVPMLGVTVGVPGTTGAQGAPGPVGLVKVTHGSDPDVARPDAPLVYWVGTVQPVNADPDDLLMLK